jgi:hypothetical protein
VPHCTRAPAKPLGNVLLRQSSLIQLNEPSDLSRTEPRMPYPLARLPHQPKDTALGDTVPPAKLGSGCPGHVLSDQTIYRLSLKPCADATFSTKTTIPSDPGWHRTRDVRPTARGSI